MGLFRYKATDLSIESVKKIIGSYEQVEAPILKKAHDYYNSQHEILKKQPAAPGRPNNMVITNYCKQIVNTYIGYLNVSQSDTSEEIIKDYLDILEECLTDALIGGIGYCLWYYDDAQLTCVKLNPSTTLILYDNSISEHIIGAVTWNKYTIYDADGNPQERVDIYVYDESTVTHYSGTTIAGATLEDNATNHFMGSVPIIEVRASINYEGIFQAIYTLQDEYNYLMSCYEDSRETFNNSFLVISGIGISEETSKDLIDGDNKVLNLPLAESQAYYLTKEDNPVNSTLPVLDQIREDIYAITCTPNFLDAKFSAASGMAIRMRLTSFIQRCQTIQAYFKKTILRLEEILGVDSEFKFNSLVPGDPESQVSAVVALNGIISRETMLSNLPDFVEDPKEELKKIEDESKIEWLNPKPVASNTDATNIGNEETNKEDNE